MPDVVRSQSADLQRVLLEHAHALHAYVQRRIPRRHQDLVSVDDVLQEVWIAASQRMPADVRDAGGWLTAVANSKLVDALRTVEAVKRGGGRPVAPAQVPSASLDGLVARLCARGRTPSRELSSREARGAVQAALAELPPEHREVITLRYLEGLGHDEIARVMQRSRAAVNSLLFRALRELQQKMGPATRFFSDARSSSSDGWRVT
jgi:RNA polymerase sigma-70 factor (ECF subfamily)